MTIQLLRNSNVQAGLGRVRLRMSDLRDAEIDEVDEGLPGPGVSFVPSGMQLPHYNR